MIKFTTVEQVVTKEKNELLPLPPATPPITSPFPLELENGATYDLATVTIDLRGDRDGVLLLAAINWSVAFAPSVALIPGWINVTFQLLRNDLLIYEVTESALQAPIGQQTPALAVPGMTDFRIASLRFLDMAPALACPGRLQYTLRATNIMITATTAVDGEEPPPPPLAQIGAVTLTAEEVEACHCRD